LVTNNLADYAMPVHADVQQIDAYFTDHPDYVLNPVGARGVGEIGITGVAASIANAIYHATGNRVRALPITPEKMLALRE
jgi:xanthine dehydrogenase YagR molybdenum-binding subunit